MRAAGRGRRFARLLAVAGLLVLLAQLIPVDRSNPAVESTIPLPAGVDAILRTSCFDCHSNETVWPWYSYVAPVSWVVARDVHQARAELNFSEWNRLDAEARRRAFEDILEEVQSGEMPMSIYLPMHPDARLTDAEKAAIEAWIRTATARTPTPPAP